MRRYILLFALLFVAPPAGAAEFDPKAIDAAVAKALKEFDAPGAAVVIVKDGQVIYLKGFGVREKGKEDRVTPDTVFPIASCSKAFTATALAALADEGKLKWDDKVRDHLDYFRLSDELADREVTLRDLLCHRTGMPRHDVLWSGLSTDSGDVIRRWGKAPPATSFRSKWEYANVPFTTAGLIAGKLDGSDWAGVIKARIFKPLGMDRSSCTWKEGAAQPDHATAHYYGLDKSTTAIKWDEIDHAGGAGCINSTARDMGAWLQFQLAGGKFDGRRLVTERALRDTHTSQMLLIPEGPFAVYFPPKVTRFASYGLGWFVHDYRGTNCVSHGGTLTGFRAQCMLVPEKKLGVFVLCNLRPSYVCETVCKTALDALLELPAEDWTAFHKVQLAALDFSTAAAKKKRESARKPDTKPSLALKEYAGAFEERAYGRAEVTVENDKLMIRCGKYTFRVEHYHFDTFTAVPVEPKDDVLSFDRSTFDVQFRLGTSGEVQSMRFLEQEFPRAKK
ncbi:serine hydrolase [Gemmata sp. G18]|uniref:Serine hydrolase n=1 Tax=Gemmata palustris TaxID=2822762 RepID=A0ABS5C1F0_9BACT|nr:serine hydrolase [Gemmata palustris]MBP3959797.1 serine hydrolase [Gemmata palustris]